MFYIKAVSIHDHTTDLYYMGKRGTVFHELTVECANHRGYDTKAKAQAAIPRIKKRDAREQINSDNSYFVAYLDEGGLYYIKEKRQGEYLKKIREIYQFKRFTPICGEALGYATEKLAKAAIKRAKKYDVSEGITNNEYSIEFVREEGE